MPDPRYRIQPNLDQNKMNEFLRSIGQAAPQEQLNIPPTDQQLQRDPAVEALRQLQMEAEQERLRKLREGLRGATDPGTTIPIVGGPRSDIG